MKGYHNQPELTAQAIDSNGWFHTGDVAKIDKKGHIYITGRIKNMIVLSGGKKVFPEEVESVLEKSPIFEDVCVVAKRAGIVEMSETKRIIIKADEDGTRDEYDLLKFSRSNQSNCYNQKPIVFKGDKVVEGQVIADGPSTCNGELALGKNPLIGFMTWEGYNYEDAVLLSERLVKEDVYTSVHIEEYETEASRRTKIHRCSCITRRIQDITIWRYLG